MKFLKKNKIGLTSKKEISFFKKWKTEKHQLIIVIENSINQNITN